MKMVGYEAMMKVVDDFRITYPCSVCGKPIAIGPDEITTNQWMNV
jgi:hypothetical protein